MKKKWIIPGILAVILLAELVLLQHLTRLVWIDGKAFSAQTQQLDLSGQPLTDVAALCDFPQLQQLDLRDTGLTEIQYEALCQAMPQCQIQWLVPFQGAYYPQDTHSITVTSLSQADIETLDHLPMLKTVDASACKDYDALMALQQRRPECAVSFQLMIEGVTVPNHVRELTLTETPQSQLETLLPYLTQLESLHITGCTDGLAMYALQQQYPGCAMVYDIPLGDERYLSTDTQLTLSATLLPQLETLLPCFGSLEAVTLTGEADSALAHRLEQQWGIDFSWEFTLLGVATNTEAKQIDLSGIPMENTDAVETAMGYFSGMEKVIMCDCGLSNETMARLNETYEGTLFVWKVQLGPIVVRTDITYFMPYQHGYKLNDAQCQNLKYCTELICLDLGHQDIDQGSYLKYLTKMQYLLLADTDVADASFVLNMPELKYLEIFMTRISDLSPLASCKKLENLNLSYASPSPKDVTPLLGLTQLEQLWMRGNRYPEQQEQLRQALPNTQLMFTHGSSTGDGWRQSKNYYAMRDILGMWYSTD